MCKENTEISPPEAAENTEGAAVGEGRRPAGDSDAGSAESALVLGVRLRQYGPVYFFQAGPEQVRSGDKVLVETEQGTALAEVISARKMSLPLPVLHLPEGTTAEIRPIKGPAGKEDLATAMENKLLAAEARAFCRECIRRLVLEMKLVDVEVLYDRSKIIFYFTAPNRIDFRELVKELVHNYHTRIELRQIGVRHETQILGALGNCGMACCCRRYLRRFAPVTIKMAKEQNLFLNPAKLSGICGRLLCCLAHEQENYEEFHRNSPKLGKRYQTRQGVMKVLRANLFRQSILVENENGEELELLLDGWHALEPSRLELKPEPAASGQKAKQRRHENSGESSSLSPPADKAASAPDECSGRSGGEPDKDGRGPDEEHFSIFGLPGSRYTEKSDPEDASPRKGADSPRPRPEK
ncbi:MAG: hypothetical protein LBQ63_03290 [Deltaproteobacteria bacterium]|jgi:cell fate regulator YaaT (PSP1 superfamily)|nr:hypothetical protein [Deltaproteobacteria bacterium]